MPKAGKGDAGAAQVLFQLAGNLQEMEGDINNARNLLVSTEPHTSTLNLSECSIREIDNSQGINEVQPKETILDVFPEPMPIPQTLSKIPFPSSMLLVPLFSPHSLR